MDAFQRRARHQRALPRYFEQARRFDHQKGAKPLSATEAGVAHGLNESRRPIQFALGRLGGEELAEERLRIRRNRIEMGQKGAHFFAKFAVHCRFAQRSSVPAGSWPRSYIYGITVEPDARG